MKKRFFTLFVAVILSAISFGCSCTSFGTLSFTNAWNGGNEPSPNYTETAVYRVEYLKDGDFKADESIGDYASLKTENGILTTKLTVLAVKPSSVSSDIEIPQNSTVILYETDFSIDVKYTLKNGKEYSHTDKTSSKIYFTSMQTAYSPLYSESSKSYLLLYAGSGESSCTVISAKNETVYNKDSFVSRSAINEQPFDEFTEPDLDATVVETKQDYDYKTVIDNAELLFAIRNIQVDSSASFQLPVVSDAYSEPKALSVANKNEFSENVKIKIDGKESEGSLPLKKLFFDVDSSDARGMGQYAFVQKGANEIFPDKAVLYKYEIPVIAYGVNACMGSMVYTLTELTY